jgi:hypothetical protein
MFSFGAGLRDLPDRGVGNLTAAIANATAFAGEVESIFDKGGKR